MLLLAVKVLPSAIVSVDPVAGAVNATLFIVVADATPSVGVVNTGDVDKTVLPEPVDVVTPVPPLRTGNAVPEYVSATVPDVVIGTPDTESNEGTVTFTDVTVPVLYPFGLDAG
jgi:ABC-type Fe3+-hydroxamate transport system substrate-binding protein